MNKAWLNRYPSDVPADIVVDTGMTLIDMLEESVRNYAEQVAFINMGQAITFSQLDERSRAFAAYLVQDLGLKKGDRVAVMMPNLLQYPIALFGILRAGCVVVNVNPLYTPRELEHQLKDADTSAIVILSNFAHTLEKIIKNTCIKHVIVTHLGDELATPKRILVNFVAKHIKKMVPKFNLPQAISMQSALKKGATAEYKKPLVAPNDLAFLQYTGGTTGIAKGAMLSHLNVLANMNQAKAMYGPVLHEGNEMVVTALPLYHVFALTVNCLLFVELGGKNLLITNPRDIAAFVKDLKKYPFTALTGVNTLFNALLNNEAFTKLDFSNLRLTVGGGMAVQQAVAEKWCALTKKPIFEGYGLTECAPLVTAYPYDLIHYNGSIGLPVPSTDIRLVDENNEVLSFDQIGELQVRGPQVMQGYWQRPDATQEVLTSDGWLSTGDIVRFDADGFLHLVDRKKDVILVSGFNVYPNEIEDVVALHPKVLEVAAIGEPHAISGEIVKIYVIKRDPNLTQEELLAHCREFLTGYKIPKIIEFRQTLPKTPVGKILRRALKEERISCEKTRELEETCV